MLFIFAMDHLQKLLDMATQQGLLSPTGADPIKLRTNLYADDAVLFLRHIAAEVVNLHHLLNLFGMATGLCTNIEKSEVYRIRCDRLDITHVLGNFQVRQRKLPCKYLGLPLHIGKTRR
jgi:hypothetical protein